MRLKIKPIVQTLFVCIVIVLSSCSEKKENPKTTSKDKNVLFIVVDDLTSTTLGCYGHPTVKTPHIDALAQEGIQFTGAYCNFAVCGPSRGSFLTGVLPETIGIIDNRTPLQNVLGDMITLPALFKQNGFYTIGMGKIFHGHKNGHGDNKAWDEYHVFETTELGEQGETRNITDGVLPWCHWKAAEGTDLDQRDGQAAEKAVELIKTKREQPFFLAVGLHKPHDPFIAPKKYFDMYPLEDCTPPELPEGWEPPYKHTLPGETVTFNKFTDNDKREFLRSYYACTSFMDAQVGKIINALKESGQMENTLIVFFGDHGYHLGEHNWWNKVTVFEKGTNAPFIVAGNSVVQKGVKSASLFEFIDIYPTLAEVFNLKNTPGYLEGESFASVLKNPEQPFRSEVYATTQRGKMVGRMIKNNDWRYIEWDEGKQGKELYDQKNDPIEYNNLAENIEYKSVIDSLSVILQSKK